MPKRDTNYMDGQRDRILNAAVRVFSKTGFHRSTMRAVAKLAKISAGTLYIHFRDKASLFRGVVKRQFDAYPQLATATLAEWQDTILAYFAEPMSAQDRQLAQMMMHLSVESMSNTSVRRLFDELSQSSEWMFEASIARDPRFERLSQLRQQSLARKIGAVWSGFETYYLLNRKSRSSAVGLELRDACAAIINGELKSP